VSWRNRAERREKRELTEERQAADNDGVRAARAYRLTLLFILCAILVRRFGDRSSLGLQAALGVLGACVLRALPHAFGRDRRRRG
jgi:hypothetical protein